MEYYVGLDVSLRQTSICVVNQAGLVVREGVVDSTCLCRKPNLAGT
jgi:transposase